MAPMKRVFIIALLSLMPALARADSVWTYQGNNPPFPNSPGDGFNLTGTVVLNNNDQAIAWNFVAGPDIFTNFNSTGSINPFACVNCTQPFAFWDIQLEIPNPLNPFQTFLISFSDGPGFVSSGTLDFPGATAADFANNFDGSVGQVVVIDNPGLWTEVVATPEPGALALLGVGLTALALTITRQAFRA